MQAEIRRQLIHASLGTLFVLMVYFLGVQTSFYISTAILVLGLLVSSLIYRNVKVPFLGGVVSRVERDYEKHFPGRGALMFVTALLILLVLFYPFKQIVLGAMIVMIYGDAASTLFGKKFGTHKIRNLTLEGTLGGIFISFLALLFLFSPAIALITATLGMLAEYLPFDDNFTIPLVSATVLLILSQLVFL